MQKLVAQHRFLHTTLADLYVKVCARTQAPSAELCLCRPTSPLVHSFLLFSFHSFAQCATKEWAAQDPDVR